MKKKIIIIGAGIAGLSAACYAQMNGYDAEIFEMHNIPGGLCTAWKRKNYTFDGCIHFLKGINPESNLHNSWKEVGAFEGKTIITYDVFMQIEGSSGKKLILYSDIDKLEKHMLELSPTDEVLTKELTDAIRNFSLGGNISLRSDTNRLIKMNMKQFIGELKDTFLKEALSIFGNLQFFIMTMSYYNSKDAGWPVGGSLEFARGIEKRFLELGGRIKYKAKVEEILVENDRVVGIRQADGTVNKADMVISAADGYATVFRMLQGKYVDEKIKNLYSQGKTYPTSIQISLGVDYDLSAAPQCLFIKIDKPVSVCGVEKSSFLLRNYCFDKTLCPPGKSIITTIILSNYDYWDKLHNNKEAYKAEKEKIAAIFIKVFEDRFPEAKGKVEVADVATPVTYARYTDVWKGAYMGWMSTPEYPILDIPNTLPNLESFYMAGQWTHSRGGLATALITARRCLMKICENDGKEFVTDID